jgi:hypothetical protein
MVTLAVMQELLSLHMLIPRQPNRPTDTSRYVTTGATVCRQESFVYVSQHRLRIQWITYKLAKYSLNAIPTVVLSRICNAQEKRLQPSRHKTQHKSNFHSCTVHFDAIEIFYTRGIQKLNNVLPLKNIYC